MRVGMKMSRSKQVKCADCGHDARPAEGDRPNSLRDYFLAFGIITPVSVAAGIWLVLNYGVL